MVANIIAAVLFKVVESLYEWVVRNRLAQAESKAAAAAAQVDALRQAHATEEEIRKAQADVERWHGELQSYKDKLEFLSKFGKEA